MAEINLPDTSLIIIRGIPGSGKTTFAEKLGLPYFETDQNMLNSDGDYKFDPKKLPEAHAINKENVKQALTLGKSCSVTNTSLTEREIENYIKIAKSINPDIKIHIITMGYPYENTHGVPKKFVDTMKERQIEITPEFMKKHNLTSTITIDEHTSDKDIQNHLMKELFHKNTSYKVGDKIELFSQFVLDDGSHITYDFNPQSNKNPNGPNKIVDIGTKVEVKSIATYKNSLMEYDIVQVKLPDDRIIKTQKDGKTPLHITKWVNKSEGIKPFMIGKHARKHTNTIKIPDGNIITAKLQVGMSIYNEYDLQKDMAIKETNKISESKSDNIKDFSVKTAQVNSELKVQNQEKLSMSKEKNHNMALEIEQRLAEASTQEKQKYITNKSKSYSTLPSNLRFEEDIVELYLKRNGTLNSKIFRHANPNFKGVSPEMLVENMTKDMYKYLNNNYQLASNPQIISKYIELGGTLNDKIFRHTNPDFKGVSPEVLVENMTKDTYKYLYTTPELALNPNVIKKFLELGGNFDSLTFLKSNKNFDGITPEILVKYMTKDTYKYLTNNQLASNPQIISQYIKLGGNFNDKIFRSVNPNFQNIGSDTFIKHMTKSSYQYLDTNPDLAFRTDIIARYLDLGGNFDDKAFRTANPGFQNISPENFIEHMTKKTYQYLNTNPKLAFNTDIINKYLELGGNFDDKAFRTANPGFQNISPDTFMEHMTKFTYQHLHSNSKLAFNTKIIEKYLELGGTFNTTTFLTSNIYFKGVSSDTLLQNMTKETYQYLYLNPKLASNPQIISRYMELGGKFDSVAFLKSNKNFIGVNPELLVKYMKQETYKHLDTNFVLASHPDVIARYIELGGKLENVHVTNIKNSKSGFFNTDIFKTTDKLIHQKNTLKTKTTTQIDMSNAPHVLNKQVVGKKLGIPLMALSVLDLQRILKEGQDSEFKDLYISQAGVVTVDASVGVASLLSTRGQNILQKLGVVGIVGYGAIESFIGYKEHNNIKMIRGATETGAALLGMNLLAGTGAVASTGGTMLLVMSVGALVKDIGNAINDMEHTKISKDKIQSLFASMPMDTATLKQLSNPKYKELAILGQTILKSEAIMAQYRDDNKDFNPRFTSILDIAYTGAKQLKRDTTAQWITSLKELYRESNYNLKIIDTLLHEFTQAQALQSTKYKMIDDPRNIHINSDTDPVINRFIKNITDNPQKVSFIMNPHLKQLAQRIKLHNNEYKDTSSIQQFVYSFIDNHASLSDIKSDIADFMESTKDAHVHIAQDLDDIDNTINAIIKISHTSKDMVPIDDSKTVTLVEYGR